MSSDLSRRSRKKAESQQHLVDCAAELFASRGYEATTMEDVGDCADVSRATVFNHFPRKEDLILAWFDSRRAGFADMLAASDDQPGEVTSRLRGAFHALARIFENDPRTGRGMMRAWLHAGGPLLTPNSDTTRLFVDVVRAGQERGEIAPDTDAERVGRLLFDAYSGVLYRWVTAEDANTGLADELMATLDLILNGIAPPPAARQ